MLHLPLQGLGVVRAALSCAGSLPDHVYISHNHTDHAGGLPVPFLQETSQPPPPALFAKALAWSLAQLLGPNVCYHGLLFCTQVSVPSTVCLFVSTALLTRNQQRLCTGGADLSIVSKHCPRPPPLHLLLLKPLTLVS